MVSIYPDKICLFPSLKMITDVEKSGKYRKLYFGLYDDKVIITDLKKYIPIGASVDNMSKLHWSVFKSDYYKSIEQFIKTGDGYDLRHFCYGVAGCLPDLAKMCGFWYSPLFRLMYRIVVNRVSPHCGNDANIQVWMIDKDTVAYAIMDECRLFGETFLLPEERDHSSVMAVLDSAMASFEYNCYLIDKGVDGKMLFTRYEA